MKTSVLFTALLIGSVMATNAMAAETATVNFHGTLLATGCSFNAESENKNVDLGTHTVNFINAGNESTPKAFQLTISGCTLAAAGSTANVPVDLVKLTFADTYRGSYTGSALAGRMTQSAEGALNTEIHVKLENQELNFSSDKTELKLSEVSGFTPASATLNFNAWMKKESSTDATAGDVYGQMTVTIEYL